VTERHVLRIAHAHGNRRHRIEEAMAAGVDLIEADIRHYRGRIWVRHEFRAPFLPVLYNGRLNPFHRQGPWALSLRRLFLRLDLNPLPLDELLDIVGDRVGILFDLKYARYPEREARAFVHTLLHMLETWFHGPIDFCGNWSLLDLVVAEHDARLPVHYSIDGERQWKKLLQQIQAGTPFRTITIRRSMLDDQRAEILRAAGIDYYCWDIDSSTEAEAAIERGASGIISHNLDVLSALPAPPGRRKEAS
jgi:glycerophosphoryl diester phosphodiesterase